MKRFIVSFILMVGFYVNYSGAQEVVFDKQPLVINGITLQAEVAETTEQRQQGLMNRKTLDQGHGMLFKFDVDSAPCFWMKNTYIPLSLAFINKDGFILQIEQLSPESTHLACSEYPIRYALEVQQGWFYEQNIDVGAKVEGINRSTP